MELSPFLILKLYLTSNEHLTMAEFINFHLPFTETSIKVFEVIAPSM